MDRQRALDLAAKLLKMDADSGCSPEEANNAAEKLARIAADNNLDMLSIKAHAMRDKIRAEEAPLPWSHPERWAVDLGFEVGAALRCRVLYHRSSWTCKPHFTIIGEETEAALCRYFLNYLYELLPKMCLDYRKRAGLRSDGRDAYGVTWHRLWTSWHSGARIAIVRRLRTMYADWFAGLDAEKKEQANGLIVIKGAAIAEFVEKAFPKVRHMKQRELDLDARAQRAGFDDGQSVALSQGLRGSAVNSPRIGG